MSRPRSAPILLALLLLMPLTGFLAVSSAEQIFVSPSFSYTTSLPADSAADSAADLAADSRAAAFSFSPLTDGGNGQLIAAGWTSVVPAQTAPKFNDLPWWERTALDGDRDGIHDSLAGLNGAVWVGLSYGRDVVAADIVAIEALGLTVTVEIPAVDALLLGAIDAARIPALAALDGVVMVEQYGEVVFYGDVQTQAVKARPSDVYPEGAWNLSVSGVGVNIALTDTGVDDEHPGLVGKFVAGYDAVCFLHTDPACLLAGGRETDGSFNPDDGNQHGTACMGMASATGLEADGSQSEYYGAAPNASLIDVRIGTDAGAGPFENYFLSQEFYESAMNGIQWIIDNGETEWSGAEAENSGIDIISLSWGITSHESGGSDGEDMHSRILNEATEAGITNSVAAGNDGPGNDGLSGMGSSSLSITVGATDDLNTIDRSNDTVAGYSSRGPRRDNGDGNPLDELKPEISAPGSNIIQAEGCVTTGSCNNFFGGDAASNTYTSRGSGTSYATPSVSGIIALVIEANPELDPIQIKEILKQTAERRGEASQPDVDPYWNRDFGWGMIDARAAVELALYLNESGQTTTFLPTIQNHLLNATGINGSGEPILIEGQAWSQESTVGGVEYRIDAGQWNLATYNESALELQPFTPIDWMVALEPSTLGDGFHTIEVRAVSGESYSLPIVVEVQGIPAELSSGSLGLILAIIGLVVAVAFIVGFLIISKTSNSESEYSELLATDGLGVVGESKGRPGLGRRIGLGRGEKESGGDNEDWGEDILEAEIMPDGGTSSLEEADLLKMKIPELKQFLRDRGLLLSGNKAVLIERLKESNI